VDEVTDTKVPAFPNVLIVVTDAAVLVDGEVVDRGSAGGPDTDVAIHLGVHAAARRVAQPLGRPVRGTLRSGSDEKRLVIYPDGSVTDVEDTFSVVNLVASAGTRAVPTTRRARRTLTALRARRNRIAIRGAYLAVGAVVVGGVVVQAATNRGDDPPPVTSDAQEELPLPEPVVEPTSPATPAIVEGTRVDPLPGLGNVVVRPETGGFQLQVTTKRATRVTVRAALLSGDDGTRLWTFRTVQATTRTLEVDDLPAGTYRWEVRAPGERPVTGRVVVRPTPEPPTIVNIGTQTQPEPAPSNDPPPPSGDNNDAGSGDSDSTVDGPTEPVDPDEPFAR